ncbi:Protein FIZZY-RELATED 2 [Glycine soja]
MEDSSGHLNIPPAAAAATLRHVDRMINSNHYTSPSRTIYSDRFIPSRSASKFALFDIAWPPGGGDDSSSAYTTLLRTALFGPDIEPPHSPAMTLPSRNIFRYKTETRQSMHSHSPFLCDDSVPGVVHGPVKAPRKVPRSPFKVLDAPALQDDFYLNLVDWSSHNVLAVGLGNCVYLWNACSSKVTKLCDLGIDDLVCSVGWAQRGTHLAVGTSNGKVQRRRCGGSIAVVDAEALMHFVSSKLVFAKTMKETWQKEVSIGVKCQDDDAIWDASRCKKIRSMEGHRLRVGTLAWSSSLLSSGGRDKNIYQRDIRAQEDFVSKLSGHKSEVCGLKWSYDNRELASGGNDNRLFVWNQHSTQPVLKYCEHTAAVKAIAWSPHLHGLLASGGGTADRCIRFWNTTTNSHLSCMDTGSQVCNLVWSKNVNELVSTHGYSQNQIIVWRYPSMSKLATLTGHTYRVLYLAISPDGQTIVTGAGDETLRFWNVFPSPKSQKEQKEISE